MYLIIFIIFIILIIFFLIPTKNRLVKLDKIIFDLKKFKKIAPTSQHYAIIENIAFFAAIKTLPGYIFWSLTRRRKIIPSELLEIADLPLPVWEKELYEDLDYVERKEFPGLSKPLRKLLYDYINKESSNVKIVDLGCGGMEVERQVIAKLIEKDSQFSPILIGIDSAPQAWDAIKATFKDLRGNVEIKKFDSVDSIKNFSARKPTIIFYCGDALDIAHSHGKHFDVIMSSRFRHHLTQDEKIKLDTISLKIANKSIEFDDYRSAFSWIAPVLTAWHRPILLNGAIFSQIRQPWKKDLKKERKTISRTKIYFYSPPGSYAKITDKK